jgi:biotin transport system ATP-binding protein
MPLLEIRNLCFRFPDGTLALDAMNLVIESGDFLVIAGPNGSGKTVLARHLNGLYRPTSGTILLDGSPVKAHDKGLRRRVGLVFQDADSQIVGHTVELDTAFGPVNLGLPEEEVQRRVDFSLAVVGLQEHRGKEPHSLSGGEKRRLALAGVLAMNPDILMLDEPFANLDYPGTVAVLRCLLSLHKKGHTIVLITHDVGKVLAHATGLVIMDRGRNVFAGLPDAGLDLLERYGVRRPFGDRRSVESMTWLPELPVGPDPSAPW